MIWSISKSQEENLEIAECLTDVMLEFLKFFPSSYAELPLDTFKTFLSEIGENKFDKEVWFDRLFYLYNFLCFSVSIVSEKGFPFLECTSFS